MIRKIYSQTDVVTMARLRIKNLFNSVNSVVMNYSGGKDSICLDDLVYQMCLSGEIDKEKLTVNFLDEEAIFPCVEQIVKKCRMKWLSLGVPFNWWCIQVKHYNCFNSLTKDESFICWDETKKDVWVRPMPPFAITSDPILDERHDTYQQFFDKKFKNTVIIVGLRASESIQRYQALANRKGNDKVYPIYDWTDTDVWNYIREHELEYPDAYEHMFRIGVPRNNMRISQFFSIDTARNLVQLNEFYPELMDKIIQREPNAYLAMLYYDTELFRRGKKRNETQPVDYKEKFFEAMKESWRFETKQGQKLRRELNNMALKYASVIDNKIWKKMYEVAIAGDPKSRTLRALTVAIGTKIREG